MNALSAHTSEPSRPTGAPSLRGNSNTHRDNRGSWMKGIRFCTYYKMINHYVDSCFKFHGHPKKANLTFTPPIANSSDMISDNALMTRQKFALLQQQQQCLQSSEVSTLGTKPFANHTSYHSWITILRPQTIWSVCLPFLFPFPCFPWSSQIS